IIANDHRSGRVDERHLHDLAIAADHEAGIGHLQSADEYLFVDFGALADFHVRRVQKRHRTDLDVRYQPDFLPTNNREKANRSVLADLDVFTTNSRAEADRYALADPVAFEPVQENLDEPGPKPIKKHRSDRNSRLFNQHRRGSIHSSWTHSKERASHTYMLRSAGSSTSTRCFLNR